MPSVRRLAVTTLGIKTLDLFVTNITSLVGIGKFPILRKLTIYNAPHLIDISALKEVRGTLEILEFDSCNRIESYDGLSEATALKKLIISKSGPIQSLSFIKSLVNLDFLSFVKTNLVDGDLSPALRLNYVGFENKKHYSHTFDEISS